MGLREEFDAILRRVDLTSEAITDMDDMNVRHFTTKLARLNLTKTQRDASATKAEFRREDETLIRAGRAQEVLARNVASLGIDLESRERPRLVTVNGVALRS